MWDEATMANKVVASSVNNVLRLITCCDLLFGGKVFVCLSDFCQTCPIIRGGSHAQVIDASIHSSSLWSSFTVYCLIMLIQNAQDPKYAHFVDAVSDSAESTMNLNILQQVDESEDLIDFVYPAHIQNSPQDCLQQAILVPTNTQINAYNSEIIDTITGDAHMYYAADTLKEAHKAGLDMSNSLLDYAAHQTPPGLLPHALQLKVNGVYHLVCNLSIDHGLTKNTRVVILNLR